MAIRQPRTHVAEPYLADVATLPPVDPEFKHPVHDGGGAPEGANSDPAPQQPAVNALAMSQSADRYIAPELSVRATAALLLYFEDRFGLERLEELWRRERLPLSLKYLKTPTNYLSLEFLEMLCDLLIRESNDPKFTRTAGLYTAKPEAIGFAYYMLKAFGSPKICYQKTIELGPTYNRVGTFSVDRLDRTELVFTYKSKVREHSRNICELRMGQFSSFPTIWGLPPAQVIELQCQVTGADLCRYHVTWRAPLRPWRRLVGFMLGGGAGLAVTSLASVSVPVTPTVAFFAVTGGVIGAWLHLRSELRLKDEYVFATNKGLLDSLTDLELRYEEVYKTKIQLEQRVAERTKEISEAKDSLQDANQKLEVALERQRELDKLKTQFFNNVSHELRTPLTLILLSLDSVLRDQRTDIPPALQNHLETVDRGAKRLLRLINELLDLAKIEAGKMRLRYESVDLISFLRSILVPFRVLAERKRIQLPIEGPDGAPVLADAEKLHAVFQNLISNALKFTPDGGTVRIKVSQDTDNVFIEIVDTGMGIAQQDLAVIFDRFAQADSSGVRRLGGTGIGLALVKELVELHHGTISVTSKPGAGSCFRVSLPKGTTHLREELRERRAEEIPVWRERRTADPIGSALSQSALPENALEPEPVPETASPSQLQRKKILVVEDDPSMRRFVCNILRPHYSIIEAADGKEGLEQTVRQRPDLVLSDVVMPVMSGLQLADALKSSPETADIPIILLTARSEAENAVQGLSSGANDYIGKPFSPRELLARIETQLRLREAASRIAESERLAAVGLMTSGFAHEVRNPLNGLLNALRPLRNAPAEIGSAESAELVQIVEDCGQRIGHLAESLLQFARPTPGGKSLVDVPGSLESTLRLLRWRTPPAVQIERDYRCKDLIIGDAAALNQVWLNLLDNALRAVGESGRIVLGTERVDNELLVTVADSGCGISEDVLRRVFEPFFSTRPAGEGTGLGLSLARRIVMQHNGRISVQSELAKGSKFVVSLPIKGSTVQPYVLTDEPRKQPS